MRSVQRALILLSGFSLAACRSATKPDDYIEVPPNCDCWRDLSATFGSHNEAALVMLDGMLYVVGGGRTVGATQLVEQFDPVTNRWAKMASMPTPRPGLGAVALQGLLYAMGGYDVEGHCDNYAVVEAFNPRTNTWTSKAPMLTARRNFGIAVVNGLVYTIGGMVSGTCSASNVVEVYDPATDSWSVRTPMPVAKATAAAVAVDGKIYLIGGSDPTEEYDPVTDTWSLKAPLPHPRSWLGAAEVFGKVYAVGGMVRNGSAPYVNSEDNDVYDPKTDTWTSRAPMPTPYPFPGVTSYHGLVYVIADSTLLGYMYQ